MKLIKNYVYLLFLNVTNHDYATKFQDKEEGAGVTFFRISSLLHNNENQKQTPLLFCVDLNGWLSDRYS